MKCVQVGHKVKLCLVLCHIIALQTVGLHQIYTVARAGKEGFVKYTDYALWLDMIKGQNYVSINFFSKYRT